MTVITETPTVTELTHTEERVQYAVGDCCAVHLAYGDTEALNIYDEDADDEDAAPSSRPVRAAAPSTSDDDEEAAPAPVDDATREAGTVGHEEFGHHDDDAIPTTQFAMGPLGGPTGWEHESPADTDDEATRGLFAPGKYDPDMTDQIPQIRIDQAWGTEWTPPQEPESEDPGKK